MTNQVCQHIWATWTLPKAFQLDIYDLLTSQSLSLVEKEVCKFLTGKLDF